MKLAIVVALVACSAPARPPPTTTTATRSPAPPARVTVLDRGSEPQQVLRYPVTAGPRAVTLAWKAVVPPKPMRRRGLGEPLEVPASDTHGGTSRGTFAIVRGHGTLTIDGTTVTHAI